MVEEKADEIIEEMKSSLSIDEVGTEITFKNASSNTENTVALHYTITNDGEVTLLFDSENNELKSTTVTMEKDNVESGSDFVATVSAFASISDFDIDEEYQQIGEIVNEMKATKVGDLSVSMKVNDGIYEFMMIRE